MARQPDHVAEAKAKADERRRASAAEAEEYAQKVAAVREAGAAQRAADLEADRKAMAQAAKESQELVEQLRQQEREHAEALHAEVTRLMAEREARIDAEAAAALEARLKAEEGIDPSIGPQVVLDPHSALARAARGGAARTMQENAVAAELAMNEGAA